MSGSGTWAPSLTPVVYNGKKSGFINEVGQINTGTNYPFPSSLGAGSLNRSSYVKGRTSHYGAGAGPQATNESGSYHLAMKAGPMYWEAGDTARDHITFCERTGTSNATGFHSARSYQMFNLSTLNYMMHHNEQWRKQLGSQLHSIAVESKWAYCGVQRSSQVLENTTNVYNSVVAFTMYGRHSIPNVFVGAQPSGENTGSLTEGQEVWLLLRRHRYTDKQSHNDASQYDPNASVYARKRTLENDLNGSAKRRKDFSLMAPVYRAPAPKPFDMKTLAALMEASYVNYVNDVVVGKPSVNTKDAPLHAPVEFTEDSIRYQHPTVQEEAAAKQDKREYYWSYDPYISRTGCPPPMHLYNGDPQGDIHNQYFGSCFKLGIMIHATRGPQNSTTKQRQYAADVLQPPRRGLSYQESANNLDKVELHLRIRHTPEEV